MRKTAGKFTLLLTMLLAICTMVFVACSYELEKPDYYFSIGNGESMEDDSFITSESLDVFSSIDSTELQSSILDESFSHEGMSTPSYSLESEAESSWYSSEYSSEEISDSSIESSLETSSDSFEDSSNSTSLDSSSTMEDSSMDSNDSSSSSSSTPSCSDQDHQQGDIPVDHNFIILQENPTCLSSGMYKEYCLGCGLVLRDEFYPALGHTRITVPGYESTCNTHGITESAYCGRCNVVLQRAEPLPFSDHMYLEGCCPWCDLSELKYEVVKKDFQDPYAMCVGAVKRARYVVIPAQVTILDKNGLPCTYDVKEIKALAFEGYHELYSVEIGENVEIIGEGAFDLCYNLKEVYDRSKTQVTKMGPDKNGNISAFVKLEDFHYKEYTSKISFSETGCIIYTDGIESILIGCRNTHNKVIIPEGVTHIAGYVFEYCYYVTEVVIAASVQYIERYAFYYECANHDVDVENHLQCKSPIHSVTFMNPYDWYIKFNLVYHDPIKMDADLSNPLEAWYHLVILRDRYWFQEDFLGNIVT